MTSLGVVLLVTALIDVVHAGRRDRIVPVAVAAVAVAFCAAIGVGMPVGEAAVFAGSIGLLETTVWTLGPVRLQPRWSLTAIGIVVAFRVATAAAWTVGPESLVQRWANRSVGLVTQAGPERLVYVVGAAAFLATAANTLVRLLLKSLPNVDLDGSDRLPGGGRVIGSLERLLIFGLALGGEATAAALVVSAKGVLRFAEVRAEPRDQVDRVTEYVLVGSLASYALAMAFVPLALP